MTDQTKKLGLNDISMDLNLIGEVRFDLMGFAILWIILGHIHNQINLPLFIKYPIFNLGYGGVEIFLFCSGFGIYYSLSKEPNLFNFFQKRILRFIPAFPFFLLYLILNNVKDFHIVISYFTFESFWINEYQFAYLSYLFLFYILSPILKNIIENKLSSIYRQCYFLIFLFILTIPYWHNYKLIGISRILMYFIGMCAGYWNYNKHKISNKFSISLIVVSILGLFGLLCTHTLWYEYRIEYGLAFYFMSMFIPGLIFILCLLFNKIRVFNLFNFLDKRSLEIFLVEMLIICFWTDLPYYIHIICSILIGSIYYDIQNRVKLKFKKVKLQG